MELKNQKKTKKNKNKVSYFHNANHNLGVRLALFRLPFTFPRIRTFPRELRLLVTHAPSISAQFQHLSFHFYYPFSHDTFF